MSLRDDDLGSIPEEVQRIVHVVLPRGNTITRLRDEFGALYSNDIFREIFPKRGRPAVPPWRLALVTVFQFVENLTDRQAAEQVRMRLDWKYALGLELADPGFDHTVLCEFRRRLLETHATTLLDTLLTVFRAKGLVQARGKQRTDSTHVLAHLRILNLLECLIQTMHAALNDLAVLAPEWLTALAPPAWFERYAERVDSSRLPKSQAARTAYFETVGTDALMLLDALDSLNCPSTWRENEHVVLLRQLLARHFERTDQGVSVSGDRAVPRDEAVKSPYEPEARTVSKGTTVWTGYKVHFTETCDEDAPHLITVVQTTSALVPDGAVTNAVHVALRRHNLVPTVHLVDTGYTSADLILDAVKQHDVELLGPVRANNSWQSKDEQAYDLTRFTVDWQARHVRCPQGHLSTMWAERLERNQRPVIQVRFSRHDCTPCPSRALCTRSAARPRNLILPPQAQYEELERLRALQKTPAWRTRYRLRAGIEGTISQGVRAFGARRSRYRGLAKTTVQEGAIAASMNVVRVIAWLDGKRPETTRTSQFARLRRAT